MDTNLSTGTGQEVKTLPAVIQSLGKVRQDTYTHAPSMKMNLTLEILLDSR